MGEDAAHVVRDRPHDKAVEQRHLAPGTGAGDDPPGRQKAKVAHRRVEPLGPALGIFLRHCKRPRDAPPGVLDRLVNGLAGDRPIGRPPEPVFHVPDLLRDRGDGSHVCAFTNVRRRLCQQPRQSASSAFVRGPFGSADVPGKITRPVASPSCPAQGKQNPAGQVFRLRRLHAEARSKRQTGARKKGG